MSGTVITIELATVAQLFQFKQDGFELAPFPGYTSDQWGIKAHNRPWVESRMQLEPGMRVMEVGGAFSSLPKRLHDLYQVEAWVGDDFGASGDQSALWTRWGEPTKLPEKNKPVKYVFQPLGIYSNEYPDNYFDYIFTVSTLEHIAFAAIPDVLRDIHRCLKPQGKQIHTIDLDPNIALWDACCMRLHERFPRLSFILPRPASPLNPWLSAFEKAGFKTRAQLPPVREFLARDTLVESPDVVYRFYPPNNTAKPYRPAASLLVEIDKTS